MFYYKYKDKILFSNKIFNEFTRISEEEACKNGEELFFIIQKDPKIFRRHYCISHFDLISIIQEDIDLIDINRKTSEDIIHELPQWILSKIYNHEVSALNISYNNWQDILTAAKLYNCKENFLRINVIGLGDVGGMLITGLKLLGGDLFSTIGIFDKDINKMKRWEYEGNQIFDMNTSRYPKIISLEESELFNCDLFVFCVSMSVPEVGKETEDIRLSQFTGNSKIISYYAKLSRSFNYKGLFCVVSDPVDLLCKVVFKESNTNELGSFDSNGLAPDQIRGYGLGVMNARAVYYASQEERTKHYITEGRAFGPHGEGLIVADSIINYNEALSLYLTEKAVKANLEVRASGFKPFVAPALSSGALSIIATLKQEWQYSSIFIGGTFMGCKNKQHSTGIELERLCLPPQLKTRLKNTYSYLQNII